MVTIIFFINSGKDFEYIDEKSTYLEHAVNLLRLTFLNIIVLLFVLLTIQNL